MLDIPFEIGADIFISSLKQRQVSARSRIVGARIGEFILVDTPVSKLNDRFHSEMGQDVYCGYIRDGESYHFATRIIKDLGEGITMMDYPVQFNHAILRKHPRIKGKLRTRFIVKTRSQSEDREGYIVDISEGGCRVFIDAVMPLVSNTQCLLDFHLPGGEHIAGLEGLVLKANCNRKTKNTEVSVEFTGPSEYTARIGIFCQIAASFLL